MSSFAAIAEHFLQELAPVSYAASGAISLAAQRARLNSAAGALTMTLAAPGTSLLPGQCILIVFEDATTPSTVAYPCSGGTRTRTLSVVGEAILLLALDASRYIEVLGSAQGAAFTQTYATADKTIAAVTTHAITDSSGGTPSTSALAAQAVTVAASACAGGATPTATQVDTAVDGLETAINAQLVIIRDNIATVNAELTLAKADLLADKKNLNSVIDDLQARGISG